MFFYFYWSTSVWVNHNLSISFLIWCLDFSFSEPFCKFARKIKAGQVRFLICTDVAARGIDVQGIPYVINVTMPDDKANYLHRIGRVGRAKRMGLAIR